LLPKSIIIIGKPNPVIPPYEIDIPNDDRVLLIYLAFFNLPVLFDFVASASDGKTCPAGPRGSAHSTFGIAKVL